jgi:hypothetical protein
MSKFNNPIQKYSIDAILVIVFMTAWYIIGNIDLDSIYYYMFLGVMDFMLYAKALKFNQDAHER